MFHSGQGSGNGRSIWTSDWAKVRSLGCEIPPPGCVLLVARGEFTQPRNELLHGRHPVRRGPHADDAAADPGPDVARLERGLHRPLELRVGVDGGHPACRTGGVKIESGAAIMIMLSFGIGYERWWIEGLLFARICFSKARFQKFRVGDGGIHSHSRGHAREHTQAGENCDLTTRPM